MSTKREAAHLRARRGFDVFPIIPNGKRPLIENWQNLATRDPVQIDKWWDEWPEANIGWPTQYSIVIDIDPRKGGAETFLALQDLYDIPKTTRHATQGGGDHLIYAAPDRRPVKGGNDKLGPGLDIKARGGYILLPGSTIDGRPYEVGNTREVALAPAWLVAQCHVGKEKNGASGTRIVDEDDLSRELFESWMLNHAPTAETGNIDNTTYKVAARGYDYGCGESTVLDVLLEWNDTHCFPPQDIEDLERVTESAGRNRENAIGSKHPLAPGFEAVEIDKPKPATGIRAENFFAAAKMALADAAEPLIKGILDRGAMSILYGESNTGKTFIAIDMSFHIALGRAWTGRKTRQGCVVYVAAEGGRGVYKRLAALHKANPDLTDVPLFVVKAPIDLLHGPEHAKALVKICREVAEQSGHVLELIVIDTLSRAMSGGDENSSTDMGGIVKSFDAIREVTSAHVMVIHHSGKDRARGARGHSLLRAATDTEIEIERGMVTVTKQRDMDGEFKQAFKLKTVNIGRDADGDNVTSCVVCLVTKQEAEAGPAPVSRGLMELVLGLDKALDCHPAQPFGIGFVAHITAQMDGIKNPDHASDHTRPRTTLVGNMKTLVESGWFLKDERGQYVRRLVGKSRPVDLASFHSGREGLPLGETDQDAEIEK